VTKVVQVHEKAGARAVDLDNINEQVQTIETNSTEPRHLQL